MQFELKIVLIIFIENRGEMKTFLDKSQNKHTRVVLAQTRNVDKCLSGIE